MPSVSEVPERLSKEQPRFTSSQGFHTMNPLSHHEPPPPFAHVCICTKTKEESREKVKRKVIPNCINLLVWLP